MSHSISRREFLKKTSAAIALSAAVADRKASAKSGKRPNLVFMFPDQFRRQAIGFMNADPVITPRLDKFAADHGEMMGSHNRMHKSVVYEESTGIPFIIRWPGRIPARHDDLLLSPADMMPSLLGLMGLSARTPSGVEGSDYSAIMLGKPGERPNSALYIRCSGHRGGARGVRTHRYTLAVTPKQDGGKETLLFDNKDDPSQLRNIGESKPEVVRKLSDELQKWLDKTNDPWKV